MDHTNSALTTPEMTAQFTGTRCLVTGGAGFIGSNLVRALVQSGAAVTVIDDLSTGRLKNLPASGVRVIIGDLAVETRLPELAAEAEFIFHLAARVGNIKSLNQPVPDASTNILGTLRLLEAARHSSVKRIIYSSSSAIFGEAERLPIDEDHPQKPASFYALSKLTGEKYALLAASLWKVPVVSLRYFNVFGYPSQDSDYSGVISIFFRRLFERRGLVIYGDGNQTRDFIFVTDVVQAILRAAVRGLPGATYNIGTGRATSIMDLTQAILDAAKTRNVLQKEQSRPGEVRHSVADISKARRELGFEPQVDLKSGLSEYWKSINELIPV